MTINVQFADSKEMAITSVFACAQDPDCWPNQGEVEDDDPRYLAYITPPAPEVLSDPLEKLKAFLLANPDVTAIIK